MADLPVISTDVVLVDQNSTLKTVQFGESVVAGDIVYLKSDNKYWKSNNSAEDTAAASGIVTIGNSADNYGQIMTAGIINLGSLGSIVTATDEYVVSGTSGKIAPKADLASGDYYTRIGYGETTTNLRLDFKATAIQKA